VDARGDWLVILPLLLQVGSVPSATPVLPSTGAECQLITPARDVLRFKVELDKGSDGIVVRPLSAGSWPTPAIGKLAFAEGRDAEYIATIGKSASFRFRFADRGGQLQAVLSQSREAGAGIPVAAGYCLDRLPLGPEAAPASVDVSDLTRWKTGACFFDSLPPNEIRADISFTKQRDDAGRRLLVFEDNRKLIWRAPVSAVQKAYSRGAVRRDGVAIAPFTFEATGSNSRLDGDLIYFIDENLRASALIRFETFDDSSRHAYAICSISAKKTANGVEF
jgi:hypothetical protein